MSDPTLRDKDPFQLWATLPVPDAKALLERFEQEGIRFELASEAQIAGMDSFSASVGGSFGAGVEIQIFTHRDDETNVERVWKEFCNFES